MAYSGSQITRLGLLGIPRGLYGSFAGKAETVSEVTTFGVYSRIDPTGQGVTGLVDETGQGVTGLMFDTFGINSRIDPTGQGVTGLIDETGQGVTGEFE